MTAALFREILQRSGEHLLLVALSVRLALLIALPLGLLIHGCASWIRLVLGLANGVQTIPSLAIFGLLLTVPILGGIGPTPAVVALTLYLSAAQVLRHVALPLAMPSLMAGLRVATVIAVGVADAALARLEQRLSRPRPRQAGVRRPAPQW